MENKRYEVMTSSLNGYAYLHDLETDDVLNTCEVCYLLNEQDERIKEYNTKIVEEMELSAMRRQIIEHLTTELNLMVNKIEKLEQQLADKESAITTVIEDSSASKELYKRQLAESEKKILELQEQSIRDNQLYNEELAEKDQDKILFAVEKLVSVQKYIDDIALDVEEEFFGREIKNFIDNRIKQLGGRYREKGELKKEVKNA